MENSRKSVLLVAKNKFDRYEHRETGMLVDRLTLRVYGKQNLDGNIDPLNLDDVKTCNQLGFKIDDGCPISLKGSNFNVQSQDS